MNPHPGDFGDFVIGCMPAILMTIVVLGCAWLLIQGIRVAIWIRRDWHALGDRERQARRERDLPQLSRAIGNVTRAMSIAEHDAAYGPKLGDLTGPDHVVTGQLAAAQDALTPRMVAPTRAQLASIRQRCTRCRTGNPQLPCMCGYDCYAADCLAETPGSNR